MKLQNIEFFRSPVAYSLLAPLTYYFLALLLILSWLLLQLHILSWLLALILSWFLLRILF
jgi:hypothetical protein